jgi:hypothetical protein
VEFTKDGVIAKLVDNRVQNSLHYGYDRLLAFSLNNRGDVALLNELPGILRSKDARVEHYNPQKRILSGTTAAPIRYFRLSAWMTPYRPRGDIFTSQDISVGKGFYEFKKWKDQTFRWASNDAEVFLSQRTKHSEVSFLIEGGPALVGDRRQFPLLVLDDNGSTIARLDVRGRQLVSVKLPENTKLIRLRVQSTNRPASTEDSRVLSFRIFNIDVR